MALTRFAWRQLAAFTMRAKPPRVQRPGEPAGTLVGLRETESPISEHDAVPVGVGRRDRREHLREVELNAPSVAPGPRYNAPDPQAISLSFVVDDYTRYTRYVAIGDSQTEGLWDGDDCVGLLGFADRLAVQIDSQHPGLHYANLAIRGTLVADVLRTQVQPALAMQPDLITVCVGMNDVIQPGRSFARALGDLETLYVALAESGATVVTTTFPNVAQFLPLGWLVSGRLARINNAIREAADRYGFRLVDLYNAPSMRDLDTWDIDRVHASTKGHTLFAAAVAEALNLPDSNHDWAKSSPNPTRLSFRSRSYGKVRWAQEKLMPWVWRRMRGLSSADGRVPKRPRLEPLGTPCAPHNDTAQQFEEFAARPQYESGILDP